MRKSETGLVLCLLTSLLLLLNSLTHVGYAPFVIDFGLSADPLSVTVVAGGSGQSTLNVSAKGNTGNLPVDLSTFYSISGVVTDLDPQQVIIPPSLGEWHYNQSTLTISSNINAAPGIYTLTVYADFGTTVKNVNITLTILPAGQRNMTVGGRIAFDNVPTMVAVYMAFTGTVAVLAVCVSVATRKKPED